MKTISRIVNFILVYLYVIISIYVGIMILQMPDHVEPNILILFYFVFSAIAIPLIVISYIIKRIAEKKDVNAK